MIRFLLVIVGAMATTQIAQAHPHVAVVARASVLFDKEGRVTGLKYDWTFDEMYSAYAIQGLADPGKTPTRAQLQPLAKVNVESLAEFDYFSFAKAGGKNLEFDAPKDYWLAADSKGVITLHFTLPLKTPLADAPNFTFQNYDPTYFVAFEFEKKDPVALIDAPAGCSQSISQPPPLLAGDAKKLADAKSENFSPGAELSIKLTPRVTVACP